jgi:sulfide:quinone oxidoreductase
MSKHYQVLVIGGGTAGIMVSSMLKRKNKSIQIGLIEPSQTHYYQPAWTLVGANTYDFEKTARPMALLIPEGVDWIQQFADKFEPENNKVLTKDGTAFTYDFLVVAPGLKIAPEMIEGLEEAMDKGIVCSNYTNPKHTWEILKKFKGGTALFTQPATPIKCGGAPQKIMYLADEYFRKEGLREKTDIVFALPSGSIFGVKIIADTLMNVVDKKDINVRFFHRLVKVDGDKKIAWYEIDKDLTAGGCVTIADGDITSLDKDIQYNYKDVKVSRRGEQYGIHFDMMHLAPPQCAPDFIKNSPLVSETGWVDVNKGTMQHVKYANIFSLGDVSNLPTSKTGAAIRKQAPVVVENILKLIETNVLSTKEYKGYTSCPLVTGYGKMVLAEFDYNQNFEPDPKLKQFPLMISDSSKEHWRLWLLKKYMLPYLYWNKMMKGIEV